MDMPPHMDMMGPPGQHEADTRLSALRSWQQPGPEPEQKDSLVKALLPLFLAQAVDMMTTENLLSQPSPPGWERPHEQNPLPGMQSTGGRLAMQALEAALVGALMHKNPKLGAASRNAMTVMHTGAALGNEQNVGENQMLMRTYAARGR